MSVRSPGEARAAVAGGAVVIDLKEPDRGPLGRTDFPVWAEVLGAVPEGTPVSVALGELREWLGPPPPPEPIGPDAFRGLAFRKIGLAGAGSGWDEAWARLRQRWAGGPPWVAVVYADWANAEAPPPDHVLDAALVADDCAGVLFDTWDKSAASPIDASWAPRFDRARRGGRFTALAGRLDAAAVARLAVLRPDIIAVRGAACFEGDRRAGIDPARVAALARAAAAVESSVGPPPRSLTTPPG